LLVISAAVIGAMFYLRSPEGRSEWDRLSLRTWLIGDLLRKFETARFSRTLAALLKGGVPLLEALGTVQGVIGNRLLARAISQVQVRVREGRGMARPLSESGMFPPLALNMIAVGEETGKLEAMLTEVATYYDQEVKRSTKRMTALLEPALILAMGLIIGIVVISMLLAIFSINDLPF
jgi:general secretion pathway protein F